MGAVGRPRLLGAPVGTELVRRGFALSPPAWSAAAIEQAPALLVEIHRDYAQAGADLVVANTTCARPVELGEAAERRCGEAIELARAAGVPVVATIAMLPRAMDPALRTTTYAAQARWSSAADVLLLEGFLDPGELQRAVEATAAWVGPRWAALAGDAAMHLAEAIDRIHAPAIELWAVHCCAAATADLALRRVDRARLGSASLGAWPSPFPDTSPEAFARELATLAHTHALGVVGCCCGGTPAILRAVREACVSSRS